MCRKIRCLNKFKNFCKFFGENKGSLLQVVGVATCKRGDRLTDMTKPREAAEDAADGGLVGAGALLE